MTIEPEANPAETLAVTLKLETAECLRHESLGFEAAVTNRGPQPAAGIPALDPKNVALQIVLETARGHKQADQHSGLIRDGRTFHEPERPALVTLAPGEAMAVRGDLLQWFGRIDPDNYRVRALYVSGLESFESAAVALDVLPVKPVDAAAPRAGTRAPGSPLINAWVNEQASGRTLLLQVNSPALPGNPRLCRRVVESFSGRDLDAAQQPLQNLPAAHVVWSASPAELGVARFDLRSQSVSVQTVKMPFTGRALRSPLSAQDGSVWIPVADSALGRYAALRADAAGGVSAVELKPGSAVPMGPHVNLWDYDANLYFAWARPESSQVRCARLPLGDTQPAFVPVLAHALDGPVVWLDGYVQPNENGGRDPVLWCVRRKADTLACCRFNARTQIVMSDTLLLTVKLPELSPIGSAVTAGTHLALLLRSDDGELYYGSTALSEIHSVRQLLGREVNAGQCPGLLAADGDAAAHWVHLRYVEADRIAVARLEPRKETDPMDRA